MSRTPPNAAINQTARPEWVRARRIVVKIGSALLADRATGDLKAEWLASLIDDVADLRASGRQVVLVSSGAVALGRFKLGLPKGPLELEQSQAAAAVGQISLAAAYQPLAGQHGMTVAQILLTLGDTEQRRRYLNARHTIETLLELGAIPVVNENDTVVTDEIKFGDNDTLGALVTNLIEADALIILTDKGGLFSADPRNDSNAHLIQEGQAGDPALEKMAGGAGSDLGKGGMLTKVLAAKVAAQSGADTVIASGLEENVLVRLAKGESIGSQLTAKK